MRDQEDREAGPRAGGQRPPVRFRRGLHPEQGGGRSRRLGEGASHPLPAAGDRGEQRQRERLHRGRRDARGPRDVPGGRHRPRPAGRFAPDRLHRRHRRAAAGGKDRRGPAGPRRPPLAEGDRGGRGGDPYDRRVPEARGPEDPRGGAHDHDRRDPPWLPPTPGACCGRRPALRSTASSSTATRAPTTPRPCSPTARAACLRWKGRTSPRSGRRSCRCCWTSP